MLRCQVVGQDVRCNLMTIKKQHVRFDSSMSVVIDDDMQLSYVYLYYKGSFQLAMPKGIYIGLQSNKSVILKF